jgi:hypothetical protein
MDCADSILWIPGARRRDLGDEPHEDQGQIEPPNLGTKSPYPSTFCDL